MSNVRKLILQVRKRINPNVLEFAQKLSEKGIGERIRIHIIHADDRLEIINVELHGDGLHYAHIADAITRTGGTIQSVEEVELTTTPEANET